MKGKKIIRILQSMKINYDITEGELQTEHGLT